MTTMEFDQGEFTGDVEDGVPHGNGEIVYKQDDPLDRLVKMLQQ